VLILAGGLALFVRRAQAARAPATTTAAEA
jgi:hypothetical protein